MIPQIPSTSLFNRVRFVLVETSHPGNVGAAARAIKTMGFTEMFLVNPRFPDVLVSDEAQAFASGAQDVLAAARIVGSLDEALQGCAVAAALSARPREFGPPLQQARDFAQSICASNDLQCALVFGSERYGLSNEDVRRCNALITLPSNPAYSSLNLAQAVQVLAYECRMASEVGAGEQMPAVGFRDETATLDAVEGMYAHLERALVALEFLDPSNPKRLMARLRRLFSRTRLETEEVNILRGIANEILKKTG